MPKRVSITKDKFRISAPGIDVDSAADNEFILHESFLAAQPYYTEWVPCPFAGAGSGSYSASASIAGPAVVLPNTIVIFITRGSSGYNYYPANITPDTAWVVDAWFSRLDGDLTTWSGLSIFFSKTGSSAAPLGAWVIYLRSADL